MKFVYIPFVILLFSITGCKEKPETLEAKKKRLEELQKQAEILQSDILDLEKEILDIDSTAIELNLGKLVTTLNVKKQTFKHYIEIQGVANSDLNISVAPELAGEVIAIHVSEGHAVKKGDTSTD